MITKSELEKLESVALKTALKAGKLLLEAQKDLKKLDITSKKSQGIVSDADIASEEFIVNALKKANPEIEFLAEESFFTKFQGNKNSYKNFASSKYLWVIDPLDGTNNFVHGLDYFAVCISLVKDGKPILGVVHAPARKETFVARKGSGTSFYQGSVTAKNCSRLRKQKGRKNLSECFLATGFATEKGKPFNTEFKTFKEMMNHCRAIRRMGSAALDLCHTAGGIYDGFWERGLAPWDLAAASIICQEAGVKVTEYGGEDLTIFSKTILAARPNTYSLLEKVVNKK